MARGVQVGDKAPDFTLPSQAGEPVRLQDRLGERVVVLYFYPKDNTSGCTAEACAFRDSYEDFTEAGAEVIGVSSDSADKHAGFASKHRLPFTLLADQGGRVRNVSGRDRLSFPFFFDPDFTAEIPPLPGRAAVTEGGRPRWDGQNLHAFTGTYGDYLLSKVSKVFPQLRREVLADEGP